MFYEALQMVHNNQRLQTKSMNSTNNKIGTSTTVINKMASQTTVGFGSSVAIHKLRESKWFNHNESKILCSVVESGFILEKRISINEDEEHQWGIASWKSGHEKSKNMDYINVYTIVNEKDKFKVKMLTLKEFWSEETNVRINNYDDKTTHPNYELDIQKQIQHVMKHKNMKWHNSQHFAHWCRYTRPNQRTEQMTDRVKWNSVSVTAGMLMVKNKFKRPS